jgi:hypothetical protein
MYTLLRNNITYGPCTLHDLLRMSITEDDLVWMDGKSNAWVSAAEVDELKERVIATPMHTSHPEIQSMVAGFQLETNVDRLFVRAQVLAGQSTVIKEREEVDGTLITKYARSFDEIKKDYSAWIDRREHLKKIKKRMIAGAIPVAMFVAGLLAWPYLRQDTANKQSIQKESLVISAKHTTTHN